MCGNSSDAQSCPNNYVCQQGDNTINLNPNNGLTSFDNILQSVFVVFRIIQRDFWEETMQYLLATAGLWHILTFIIIIYIGSFQLFALFWSPIASTYNYLKEEEWETDFQVTSNEVQ